MREALLAYEDRLKEEAMENHRLALLVASLGGGKTPKTPDILQEE